MSLDSPQPQPAPTSAPATAKTSEVAPAPGAAPAAEVAPARGVAPAPEMPPVAAATVTTGRRPAPPWSDERRARMAWSRVAEPEDEIVAELIARLGLCDALESVLRHGAGSTSAVARRVARRAEVLDIERDLRITGSLGAEVLIPGDPGWPAALDDLPQPPWCLWVKGTLPEVHASQPAIAVVGARAATSYGIHLAGEWSASLAARGSAIVSGAALGVDGAAHRGALAVAGPTIAVLACGIDRAYPAAHGHLLSEIAVTGAVVTEMPPGSAPMRMRFLSRNRIIAALGHGTVVVEAALRSGALRTARVAQSLHRPVGVVPGPVTSAASAGCHQLAREGGAALVTDPEEVLDLVAPVGQQTDAGKRGADTARDGVGSQAQRVWEAMPVRLSTTVEALSRVAGRSESEVMLALGELEGAGLAERRLDGWGRVHRPAGQRPDRR